MRAAATFQGGTPPSRLLSRRQEPLALFLLTPLAGVQVGTPVARYPHAGTSRRGRVAALVAGAQHPGRKAAAAPGGAGRSAGTRCYLAPRVPAVKLESGAKLDGGQQPPEGGAAPLASWR